MLILAIDTSTSVCSLALYDGQTILADFTVDNGLTHSEKMMPLLLDLLKVSGVNKTDLQGIAINIGPGSFTGLRIGLASVKTLAYALKLPVVGVSSHEALAYNMPIENIYLSPLIDAQKGNVYQAIYQWQGKCLQQVEPITIKSIEEAVKTLVDSGKNSFILGEWNNEKHDLLTKKVQLAQINLLKPKAASVALASYTRFIKGEYDDVFKVQPYYLKKSEAEILWEKRCQKNI